MSGLPPREYHSPADITTLFKNFFSSSPFHSAFYSMEEKYQRDPSTLASGSPRLIYSNKIQGAVYFRPRVLLYFICILGVPMMLNMK